MMSIIKTHKKLVIGGLCIVVMLVTGVTYALLSANSQPNVNEFTGGVTKVNVAVVEAVSGDTNLEDAKNGYVSYPNIKKDETIAKVVRIKNVNSKDYVTTDTFVRVKLIAMLVSDASSEDNRQVLGDAVDVSYTFGNSSKWLKQDDTYYYSEAVKPGMTTDVFIEDVTLHSDVQDGYHLEIQVVVDAISANPITNLTTAWGLKEENGSYFHMSPIR